MIIKGDYYGEITIDIMDIKGRVVYRMRENKGQNIDFIKVNLQNLKAGVYIMEIPEMNVRKKIILE
ncbi:MAG TPA: T9SS type A sorting domain-containing protein [Bacteroidetes bacterium]|nr:T9SS type A sorting domain-containing protein [Bacteroidota bacterium]